MPEEPEPTGRQRLPYSLPHDSSNPFQARFSRAHQKARMVKKSLGPALHMYKQLEAKLEAQRTNAVLLRAEFVEAESERGGLVRRLHNELLAAGQSDTAGGASRLAMSSPRRSPFDEQRFARAPNDLDHGCSFVVAGEVGAPMGAHTESAPMVNQFKTGITTRMSHKKSQAPTLSALPAARYPAMSLGKSAAKHRPWPGCRGIAEGASAAGSALRTRRICHRYLVHSERPSNGNTGALARLGGADFNFEPAMLEAQSCVLEVKGGHATPSSRTQFPVGPPTTVDHCACSSGLGRGIKSIGALLDTDPPPQRPSTVRFGPQLTAPPAGISAHRAKHQAMFERAALEAPRVFEAVETADLRVAAESLSDCKARLRIGAHEIISPSRREVRYKRLGVDLALTRLCLSAYRCGRVMRLAGWLEGAKALHKVAEFPFGCRFALDKTAVAASITAIDPHLLAADSSMQVLSASLAAQDQLLSGADRRRGDPMREDAAGHPLVFNDPDFTAMVETLRRFKLKLPGKKTHRGRRVDAAQFEIAETCFQRHHFSGCPRPGLEGPFTGFGREWGSEPFATRVACSTSAAGAALQRAASGWESASGMQYIRAPARVEFQAFDSTVDQVWPCCAAQTHAPGSQGTRGRRRKEPRRSAAAASGGAAPDQQRCLTDAASSRVDGALLTLPGLRNPRWYCFMNAPVQGLLAIYDVRAALRTVRRGTPEDWGGWRFSERNSAEQRSRASPDFDKLLAETLWEMENNRGRRPIRLEALPPVFYDEAQEDAGEFLQELLHDGRSPVVSEIFRMEKAERLVCTMDGFGGAQEVEGDRDMTCLMVQVPRDASGRVRTVQEAVDRICGGEVMGEGYRWLCPKGCGCRQARKELQVTRPPQCLWIQLVAQAYDGVTGRVWKVPHAVMPSEELRLSGQKYTLVSCVFHHGEGFHTGHYNARCRTSHGGRARWEMRDDGEVWPSAPPSDARGWKTASDSSVHILMYARVAAVPEAERAREAGLVVGGDGLRSGAASSAARSGSSSVNETAAWERGVVDLEGPSSATSKEKRPGGLVMQGVAARKGRAPAVHILPCDLVAPVRVIRESDIRALRLLLSPCEKPEVLDVPGLEFVPGELRAHLWKAWGDAAGLLRVMRETWVRAWQGWEESWDALAGAPDAEDRCRVVEERTCKFMEFLMGEVVFEAKTDGERVADMARDGRCVGAALAHGVNASLADAIFQLVSNAGWCGHALASAEERRVACEACVEYLRNVEDAWLNLASHGGELNVAAHAGEIVRFALARHGTQAVVLPGRISLRTYSRFDGQVGPRGGYVMTFSREEIQGGSPVLGEWPREGDVSEEEGAVSFEIYNETGVDISSTCYRPVWARAEKDDLGKPPSQEAGETREVNGPGREQIEGAGSQTAAKRARLTRKSTLAEQGASAQTSALEHGSGVRSFDQAAPPPPSPRPVRRPERARSSDMASAAKEGRESEEVVRSRTARPSCAGADASAGGAGRSGTEQSKAQVVENDYTEAAGAAHVYRVRAVENGRVSADVFRGGREEGLRAAAELMKEHPTVPAVSVHGASLEDEAIFSRGAVVLPQAHCAFSRCGWRGSSNAELQEHVVSNHAEDLRDVAESLACNEEDETRRREAQYGSAYNEAIAWKVRTGAPLAALAIDRRCLFEYARSLREGAVNSLVCMVCARKFPRVEGRRGNPIEWRAVSPNADGLFGLSGAFVREHMSVDAYVERFGNVSADGEGSSGVHLRDRMEEFNDWQLTVPSKEGPVRVLCCPEDMRCGSGTWHSENTACRCCEAPLCGERKNAMVGGRGEAGEILETTKANAVVCEKSSFDEGDINAQRIEAVRTFVQRLDEECAHGGADDTSNSSEDEEGGGKAERGSKRSRVREGTASSADEAAREAVERDMLIQAGRDRKRVDRAKQIYRALDGKYVDINNRKQKVNGDMTKVRHVPGLGKGAHKLLTHIEHTSRRLSGTQEARRVMRFETNALRVRYGVPIFVTFSPDEGRNLLMVRLSRARRQDPVHKAADDEAHSRLAGGRGWPRVAPDMDGLRMDLPMATGEAGVPPWNERRRILARDPMASVDGFRILVDATLQALRERPDLPQQKMARLQRHDKESGDLYGFLPIAEGMPVALTDHIDRSEDKNLLRGRVGWVQSWACDGDDVNDLVTRGGETIVKKTPKVIFVMFDEGDDGNGGRKPRQWTIEGLTTPGLHPAVPQKKDWCAVCGCTKYKNMYPTIGQWSRADGLRVCTVCLEDKKRAGTPWQCMDCGLWKCQEAFHASQHHPPKLTTRRCVDCPERRSCRVCEHRKYEQAFARHQWELAGNSRGRGGMCAECEELKKHLVCGRCKESKIATHFAKRDVDDVERWCDKCKREAAFSRRMWNDVADKQRKCETCVKKAKVKSCVACGEEQPEGAFSRRMWNDVANKQRKCETCVKGARPPRGYWKCVQCKNCVEKAGFSAWLSRSAAQVVAETQIAAGAVETGLAQLAETAVGKVKVINDEVIVTWMTGLPEKERIIGDQTFCDRSRDDGDVARRDLFMKPCAGDSSLVANTFSDAILGGKATRAGSGRNRTGTISSNGLNMLDLILRQMVGLGSDVVFVYSDFWKHSVKVCSDEDSVLPSDATTAKRMGWTYYYAGKASFATSATTAISFFANIASVLKPLREFGVFMGFNVIFVWILLTLIFVPMCQINERLARPNSRFAIAVSKLHGMVEGPKNCCFEFWSTLRILCCPDCGLILDRETWTLRSGTEQSKAQVVENDYTEPAGAAHVHRVRAVENGRASADACRGGREDGPRAAAGLTKEHPTVPAVSVHGASLKDEAIFSRGAVELPQAHCAFSSCGWRGSSNAELQDHVVSNHAGDLRDVAEALACNEEDETRRRETQYWSAYNEAIAWKVRTGAPLAALAIDRRCLLEYARSLREGAVDSLVCMVCARKFPRVEGRRGSPIEWRAVSPNADGLFGLSGAFVRGHMSVDAYVERPDGLREAGEILETTKANAVVCEKSSFDEIDINAQRIEAARNFVQRLDEECARGGADDASNSSEDEEGGEKAGAKQIYRALDGWYVDINNRKQKVNGDVTKVRHVPELGKAAHKLLTHIEHTSRRLPGTQEARRVMRFETNALRVRCGVPIFVTFSPDEGHNLLVVRLSRTRRQDPVHKAADDEAHSRLAGGRGWPRVAPDMDGLQMDLPMAAGEAGVPPWTERRRILASDPMTSVDGFRIRVDATLHGLRVCTVCLEDKKRAGTPWQCMDCGLWKCQEAFHASQHHPSKLTTRRCVDCPERRSCRVCEHRKYEEAFARYQWELAGNSRGRGGMCAECEELKKHLVCGRCKESKIATHFAKRDVDDVERWCDKNEKLKVKSRVACGGEQPEAAFSRRMWNDVADKQRKCETCVKKAKVKSCVGCGEEQPEGAFSRRMWNDVADKQRKCETCVKGARPPRGYWKCVQCKNCVEKLLRTYGFLEAAPGPYTAVRLSHDEVVRAAVASSAPTRRPPGCERVARARLAALGKAGWLPVLFSVPLREPMEVPRALLSAVQVLVMSKRELREWREAGSIESGQVEVTGNADDLADKLVAPDIGAGSDANAITSSNGGALQGKTTTVAGYLGPEIARTFPAAVEMKKSESSESGAGAEQRPQWSRGTGRKEQQSTAKKATRQASSLERASTDHARQIPHIHALHKLNASTEALCWHLQLEHLPVLTRGKEGAPSFKKQQEPDGGDKDQKLLGQFESRIRTSHFEDQLTNFSRTIVAIGKHRETASQLHKEAEEASDNGVIHTPTRSSCVPMGLQRASAVIPAAAGAEGKRGRAPKVEVEPPLPPGCAPMGLQRASAVILLGSGGGGGNERSCAHGKHGQEGGQDAGSAAQRLAARVEARESLPIVVGCLLALAGDRLRRLPPAEELPGTAPPRGAGGAAALCRALAEQERGLFEVFRRAVLALVVADDGDDDDGEEEEEEDALEEDEEEDAEAGPQGDAAAPPAQEPPRGVKRGRG
ncbi:unnamed protein product [Prorocentrum cordatum]|uniref:Ubiquitinyl hydrolase 1 n=1 Tax=Prorocentrum cordatum TaxID=2364126 RepID=A0ABN9V7S8_9DINO|nr:unnamed protein product [Polarella glacialis]